MIEILFEKSDAAQMRFSKHGKSDGSKVAELTFDLDWGDISGDLWGEARRQQYLKKTSAQRDVDTLEQQMEEWNNLVEEVKRLKNAAATGEAVRIWYSNAPYSMCGFYQVCTILKDYDCPVSVVRLPEYKIVNENNMVIHSHWGEVDHEDMLDFARQEKPLSKVEVNYYADLWEELRRENAPLRAAVNGRLISVPANFYDFMVEGGIGDRPFREIELAAYAVKYQMGICVDLFMESVHRMLDEGRLEVVCDKDIQWQGDRILSKRGVMVSCCGVNCKACQYFGCDCEGCDVIKGKPFWLAYTGDEICDIYHCCIEEKGYRHCGICSKLPCSFYDSEDPTKSREENEEDLRSQMEQLEKML